MTLGSQKEYLDIMRKRYQEAAKQSAQCFSMKSAVRAPMPANMPSLGFAAS